jgi:hypothetical protein
MGDWRTGPHNIGPDRLVTSSHLLHSIIRTNIAGGQYDRSKKQLIMKCRTLREQLLPRIGRKQVARHSSEIGATHQDSNFAHSDKLGVLTQSPALASGTKLRRQPAP